MSQDAIPHPVLGMDAFAVVTTTVATSEDASALARALINGQFAACVQIVNVGSVYSWKETVEEHPEWMLICKIRAADYGDVEAAILALHSYETPEILAVPVLDGFQPYLDWVAAATVRQDEE